MTDNQLRGIILKWFYDKRRESFVTPEPDDFNPPIPEKDIYIAYVIS